ncbi:MAG: amidohydrolase [Chloroflexi bacterium]|nr:amidohydrolase [Chloroflexota bacterium]
MKNLTRRDFLKLSACAFGAALLAGCGGQRLAQMTATPASSAISVAPPSATGTADLILVNGKVITIDARDSIAQAIAIKDGLIQAVGKSDEMRARARASAQIIDLKGKAVTPGLIDTHCHLQVMGMMTEQYLAFLPPDVVSIATLQKKIAEVVAKIPKGKWIQGYYLTVGADGTPHKQDLDKVAPEHPVWIIQQGGHFGAANSAALKIANITASTANPQGGIIERDKSGEPSGVFYNHRAMDLLRRHITLDVKAEPRAYVITPQDAFAACGVTTFQDNNVRGVENIGAYIEVGKQGKMKIRGAINYTLEWPADVNTALNQIERYSSSTMRLAGYKFLIDGQAPTAYCHQAHNGTSWNTTTWDPAMFKRAVRALHDTGLQICVHCVGDAATDLVLDAYAEAMQANPRADPRHRIEHAVITTRDATKRMKDLGVVVGTHPTFIRVGGEGWARLFGEERAKRAMVTREWLENGVHLALGSDAPTTPWYTPQMTLAGAMLRLTLNDRVLGPDQRLTIQEALRAHTLGAAYAMHEEKSKGSIEAGKLADLAVWNQDPYSTADPIATATIAMTFVGGQVVYQG